MALPFVIGVYSAILAWANVLIVILIIAKIIQTVTGGKLGDLSSNQRTDRNNNRTGNNNNNTSNKEKTEKEKANDDKASKDKSSPDQVHGILVQDAMPSEAQEEMSKAKAE